MREEKPSLLARCNRFDRIERITKSELRQRRPCDLVLEQERERKQAALDKATAKLQERLLHVRKNAHKDRPQHCRGIAGIEIFAADPCSYCSELGATTHDHIEPVSKGGEHELLNLTRACYRCNFKKGTQKLIIFLAKRRAA